MYLSCAIWIRIINTTAFYVSIDLGVNKNTHPAIMIINARIIKIHFLLNIPFGFSSSIPSHPLRFK
ncbi:MAG: hypothetical protein Q4Q24_08570 [Methanobrevibacter ruminantium]|uniref:hypothetical protein n=1 Tax=Methanobrevibacter ruminantium TaxID=83816 RepID=UPI0026E92854|nr:hypothetical protein [Methanobrevibacter ruminantium]MDO5843304.1 hypothetical protein [Methanobrevibacter ruminantium]